MKYPSLQYAKPDIARVTRVWRQMRLTSNLTAGSLTNTR